MNQVELEAALKLIGLLNGQFTPPDTPITPDTITLFDCNGESCGQIDWDGDLKAYILRRVP